MPESRYARAMSTVPLGADATMRQRTKAHDDNQARAEAARTERALQFADALSDHAALRDRLAGNAPALAVLGLHEPVATYRVHCSTCYDGHDGGDNIAWPCDTYEAIREASDG